MCAKRFSTGPGPSQRQLRVAEVIRHRLAEVLARGDVHDPDLSRLSITVCEVSMTPDLRRATVFVMPLGGRDVDGALAALHRGKAELRHLLAGGLGLKYVPDLRFALDTTFDAMDNARRIFADPRVRADLAAPDTDDAASDFGDDGDNDGTNNGD